MSDIISGIEIWNMGKSYYDAVSNTLIDEPLQILQGAFHLSSRVTSINIW